jgi:hypothetical protein
LVAAAAVGFSAGFSAGLAASVGFGAGVGAAAAGFSAGFSGGFGAVVGVAAGPQACSSGRATSPSPTPRTARRETGLDSVDRSLGMSIVPSDCRVWSPGVDLG